MPLRGSASAGVPGKCPGAYPTYLRKGGLLRYGFVFIAFSRGRTVLLLLHCVRRFGGDLAGGSSSPAIPAWAGLIPGSGKLIPD
jgi:hypothetical protein